MDADQGIAELEASVGTEIGPTDWFTIDQARIDGFADATEDHQWIHVDQERAAAGPFGTTVAHGFLTLSLVPYLVGQLRQGNGARNGVRMGINYGLNRVRFPSPVRAGARVRARSMLISCDRIGDDTAQLVNRVTIEIEGNPKPACVADTVSRLYF